MPSRPVVKPVAKPVANLDICQACCQTSLAGQGYFWPSLVGFGDPLVKASFSWPLKAS